jgi:hypothetical protein
MKVAEPIEYYLKHAHGTVNLSIVDDHLIVNTQGVGIADRLRTIELPLSDLKKFCLVPTIGAQNLISRHGADGEMEFDQTYDSELIFSYAVGRKLKKKRVFVNSQNDNLQSVLEQMKARRPDASLLELPPADAQKQIGVMSARTAVFIIVGLLVGVPVIAAIVIILTQVLSGYK